jgi:hypothetical protein
LLDGQHLLAVKRAVTFSVTVVVLCFVKRHGNASLELQMGSPAQQKPCEACSGVLMIEGGQKPSAGAPGYGVTFRSRIPAPPIYASHCPPHKMSYSTKRPFTEEVIREATDLP